jgi:hypothetical protein
VRHGWARKQITSNVSKQHGSGSSPRSQARVPDWSYDLEPSIRHGIPIKVRLSPLNGFNKPAQRFNDIAVAGGRGLVMIRREHHHHLIQCDLFAPWKKSREIALHVG